MSSTDNRFLGLLRDSAWGFFWGLVGVAVAVLAFWWQRTDKSLTFGIVSRGPLVSVRDDAGGRLTVLFDGKPRRDLSQVVLRVFNSGNVPIAPEDFKRALTFDFHVPVLGAEVVEMMPPGLHAAVKREGQQAILEPLLLNQGDSITLKTLLAGSARPVDVSARILGVPRIHVTDFSREPYRPNPWLMFVLGLMLLPAVLVVALVIGDIRSRWEDRRERRAWAREGWKVWNEVEDCEILQMIQTGQEPPRPYRPPPDLPVIHTEDDLAAALEVARNWSDRDLAAALQLHTIREGKVVDAWRAVPYGLGRKIHTWIEECDRADPAVVRKFRSFLRTLR